MFKMQDIRTFNFIRWGAYIFFPVIIISFVFFYGWQGPTDQNREMVYGEVEVGGKVQGITAAQLARIEDQLLQQKIGLLPEQYRNFLANQPQLLRGVVTLREQVRSAANNMLVGAEARKLGIELNEQSVINQLRNDPNMSDEALTFYAQQQNFADKWALLDFMRRSQERMLASTVKTSLAHASLFEVWQEYQLRNEKIKLRIAAYPSVDYTDDVVVTQQDREDFLNENREMFHLGPQRRYAYVKVSQTELRNQISPTEEQLQAFYEQNQGEYAQAPGARVEEFFIPLIGDAPATTALKVLSEVRAEIADNPTTWSQMLEQVNTRLRDSGTSLTAYYRSPMLNALDSNRPKQYIDELLGLDVGAISTPTANDSGAYLARKIEAREGGVRPFEDVRSLVEADYIDRQLPTLLEETEAKWEAARDGVTNIREFAEKVGVEDDITTRVNATNYFIQDIGIDFQRNRDYIDMLRLQELSEVIRQADTLVVLMIVEELEERDPPLEEIRGEVDAAVRESRALELAKAAAEQGLAAIKGGAAMQDALANAPTPPFETDAFSRMEPVPALGAPLLGFQSELLGLAPGKQGMYPYGYDEDAPLGHAVWEVLEVQEADIEQFAKDRFLYEQQYLAVQRATIMQEWLADRRKQADFQVLTN